MDHGIFSTTHFRGAVLCPALATFNSRENRVSWCRSLFNFNSARRVREVPKMRTPLPQCPWL